MLKYNFINNSNIMKKALFILLIFLLIFVACKKEETKANSQIHNTRLKTYRFMNMKYTIDYNSFNKIDNVKLDSAGRISYAYCIYNQDHSLDSIIETDSVGIVTNRINIECTNFKITKYGDNIITYNNNNTINSITNFYATQGTTKYIYLDSFAIAYNENINDPQQSTGYRFDISNNIKNPFYITGFESERFALYYLLKTFLYPLTAMMPYADTKITMYYYTLNFTYKGDFNGYPLNIVLGFDTVYGGEIELPINFTYEEF